MNTYRQPNEITLPDGKTFKNFFWRVRNYGHHQVNDEAYAVVEHWYTQDQLDINDVDTRRYAKPGGPKNITQIEAHLLTLDQYAGSVLQ